MIDDPAHPVTGPARQQAVGEIVSLVDEVKAKIPAAMQSATDERFRQNYQRIAVSATLLGADVARRELNDPRKALELLKGFEDSVKGLPEARSRTNEALFL